MEQERDSGLSESFWPRLYEIFDKLKKEVTHSTPNDISLVLDDDPRLNHSVG